MGPYKKRMSNKLGRRKGKDHGCTLILILYEFYDAFKLHSNIT